MADYDGASIYALGQPSSRSCTAMWRRLLRHAVLSQLLDTLVVNTLLANNPLNNNLRFPCARRRSARVGAFLRARRRVRGDR